MPQRGLESTQSRRLEGRWSHSDGLGVGNADGANLLACDSRGRPAGTRVAPFLAGMTGGLTERVQQTVETVWATLLGLEVQRRTVGGAETPPIGTGPARAHQRAWTAKSACSARPSWRIAPPRFSSPSTGPRRTPRSRGRPPRARERDRRQPDGGPAGPSQLSMPSSGTARNRAAGERPPPLPTPLRMPGRTPVRRRASHGEVRERCTHS